MIGLTPALPARPVAAPNAGPYVLRNLDWDDLPRMTAIGKDRPDPFTYDDLAKVIESEHTLGAVCATPNGPAGYILFDVSDGTDWATHRSGRPHIGVGVVRVQVAPEWRRKGVGQFLVNTVERALVRRFSDRAAAGRLRLYATVNETWLPALLFLKGIGFRTPTDRDQAILRRPFGAACECDGYLLTRVVEWPARLVV